MALTFRFPLSVQLAGLAVLSACTLPPRFDSAEGKQRYLAARKDCAATFARSLTQQSDCMTRAADLYIRPFYRYPDLMTRAQTERHDLAVLADAHKISHKEYDRRMARSDAAISAEEDRRNTADAQPTTFARTWRTVKSWFD
jgi:hypothetical protein